MAEAALKEQTTDISALVETNPVMVLTDVKTYEQFYASIKAKIAASEPDVSTDSGRKKIKSLAYQITRSKTAIDEAGKNRTEEWRKLTNQVNAQRKRVREELEELAAEARQPVTEWERAEDERIEKVAKFFEIIALFRSLPHGAGSGTVQDHIDTLSEMNVDKDLMRERSDEAEDALSSALAHLQQVYAAMVKAEADARELERLREQEAARVKAEREAAERAEQERLAKESAERAEAEAKRREEEAAERARAEEKRLAEEAIAKAEREKQAAIAKAEAEKLALIREQERKEAARQAELDREAAEQAKREANKKHRAKLMNAAESAIRDLGIDAAIATQIVAAIIDGKIPNCRFEF
jgi:hypothetical protein